MCSSPWSKVSTAVTDHAWQTAGKGILKGDPTLMSLVATATLYSTRSFHVLPSNSVYLGSACSDTRQYSA